MTILLSFLLMISARAEVRAELADPRLLEAPIAVNDPLEVLKHLWRAGARGPFFHFEHDAIDTAHYLFVEDWSRVGPIDGDAAILFRDEKLRELVGQIARIGTPILIGSGRGHGGLAFPAGREAHRVISKLLPKFDDRAILALSGSGSLYGLQHELTHHWDDESGFSEDLITRLIPAVRGSAEALRQAHLETGYAYAHEARAYRVQLAALASATRAREWEIFENADGGLRVREVDGASWRRDEFASTIAKYNAHYATPFLELPWLTRQRLGRVASEAIPHYRRDFVKGRLSPCEFDLLEDLHGGRLMGSP